MAFHLLYSYEMLGVIESAIICGLAYWFFVERAGKMVDVITTRLNNAYGGFRRRRHDEFAALNEHLGQRPAAQPKIAVSRRTSNLEKESLAQIREKHLFGVKDAASKNLIVTAGSRPFVGMCCTQCTPESRESLIKKDQKNSNVINILQYGKQYGESNGFLSNTFCDIVQACRVQKFQYDEVSEKVMGDDRLKQAIEQVTQDTMNKMEDYQRQNPGAVQRQFTYKSVYKADENRVKMIIQNMRSALSDCLLRLTSWTLYKLLPYFITSVSASPTQIDMLKKASDTGLPLIFMPLHRSHLDYILVSFILLNNNIRSPLVAAGDNLKIPLFGWLLRGLGAFYIKRRLESNGSQKDVLYRAALHTYMMHCLKAKHNIEFYIEGGRSRTGKPLLPKSGILSVIVDAYLDGTIEDALLVPVSMNYDKIVDGNFVREQTGQPKEMESFTKAIKSIWKVLNSHYGNIRIDFNQPFSIQELVRTFNQNQYKLNSPPLLRNPSFDPLRNNEMNGMITIKKLSMERILSSRQSCSSLYGTDVEVEEQRGLVDAIARHIVYDSTNATAVMSTNAVAHILLTQYRNGCTIDQLASGLSDLTMELACSNKDVGYTGEPINVVKHALSLLGPELVVQEEDIIKPVLTKPNIIELSYYSYSLSPHYAMQGIVATAAEMLIADCENKSSEMSIKYDDLLDVSLQLCEVLSQEYILSKPCQKLDFNLSETFDNFISKGLLYEHQNAFDDHQRRSRNLARNLDLDDDYEEYGGNVTGPVYFVDMSESAIKTRHRLINVIRPLIEVYSITALCLPKILIADNNIIENNYVQCVLDEINKQLVRGICKYGEALSTDAIKNCIRLFRQWGILDAQSEGKIRTLGVQKQYRTQNSLHKIYNLISKFKTEIC